MKTLLKNFKVLFLGIFSFGIIDFVNAQCVTTPLSFSNCGAFDGTSYTNQGGANNGTAPNATCNWGSGSASTSTWISFVYNSSDPNMDFLIGDQAAGGAGNDPAIAIYSGNGCTLLGCAADNTSPAAGEGANSGKLLLSSLGLVNGTTYLVRIYNEGNTVNVKDPQLMCVPDAPCGDCYTSPCVITNINTNFTSSTWGAEANNCCTWATDKFGAVSALNCPGPGAISVDGSIYYQVSACAAGTISASLTNTSCDNAAGSQMWFIDKCNGSILSGQCSNNGDMSVANLSMSVTAGQTFYILVDSYGGNQCIFNMSLTGPVCLPVNLSNFSGTQVGEKKIFLKWVTESETNNEGFILQRSIIDPSTGEENFENIAYVKGMGNSSTETTYAYTDELEFLPEKSVSYRLMQRDFDGKTTMSAAAVVNIKDASGGFRIISMSTPENGMLNLEYFIDKPSTDISFEMYNTVGQKLVSKAIEQTQEGHHKIAIDVSEIGSGLFLYSLTNKNYKPINGKLFLKN